MKFQLVSSLKPAGDQPRTIAQVVQGLRDGKTHQVLQGITGSGKTFVMANVIQEMQRPVVVVAPNKMLTAQLYGEFKGFFPHNAVHYFISDYKYFVPQSYVPRNDRYTDKRAALDDELTQHRIASAMAALARRDVIVVASVSCIFDLGSPQVCRDLALRLAVGEVADMESIIARLAYIGYRPTDSTLAPRACRVRGQGVEVFPLYESWAYRIEVRDGRVNGIAAIDPQSGNTLKRHDRITVYPARVHILRDGWVDAAILEIEEELDGRLQELQGQGKLLEAQCLEAATLCDIDNLRKHGRCRGMENYCRALNRRSPGSAPDTLLDFLPENFLTFVDESHLMIPQIRAPHTASRSRVQNLVEHDYRLPSAMDFRPLTLAEFEGKVGQVIYVSATPGRYELQKAGDAVVEQAIRPTGLLDPEIEVEPSDGQMEHLLGEIRKRAAVGERVLVTTVSKASAEEVAAHLAGQGIRCRWLHDALDRHERAEVLNGIHDGKIDVVVGVNLLREGIDLPEVSLVAILDADKAGFLRSATAIIQTVGRAARNVNAKAILYANTVTRAMTRAIVETRRRRQQQEEHNRRRGIIPKTIGKSTRRQTTPPKLPAR